MSNRIKVAALAASMAMVAGAFTPVAAQTDLTLWTAEGEAEGAFQYVESLAAEYSEANPDVNITVVNKQVETLREDFLTSSLAGGAPEILWTVADHVGPFTASGTTQTKPKLPTGCGCGARGERDTSVGHGAAHPSLDDACRRPAMHASR